DTHPLLRERKEKKILILVITADKGLCGGFNSNILRKAVGVLNENASKEVALITAGKKGHNFFRARNVEILRDYSGWTKKIDFSKAVEVGDVLMKLYLENSVDKIYVVYNEFKSVIQQEVVLEQLLPIVPQKLEGDELAVDYIYEPDELSILENLLKKYMNVEVYRAFLESAASENGARMTAMDNATRNASEMIDSLTLHYNKARQAYITKELIEVVNGAEAL
ncbi:MAG: ATP synthase F1 subunit gamma, partial [Nitrospinales bacterium]